MGKFLDLPLDIDADTDVMDQFLGAHAHCLQRNTACKI